ncbi:MAG: N-acetylmuramoyl-L-alanine amidase [Bacteroidetes bacterium]|nr:N-acetylmuramoyl-L-alanine amidase [Bacteroidota bacterium]
MIGILLYLSKVTLLSGLLYGYYRLFLRNRFFHLYNRWFLIGIPLAALILPLVPLPSFNFFGGIDQPGSVLHAIRPGDWLETEPAPAVTNTTATSPGWQEWSLIAYLLVAGQLILIFFRQLRYIYRLSKTHTGLPIGDVQFFMTKEEGTPFTFFRKIFWHEALETDSPRAEQIFRHELYHAREKHTHDLLFLQTLKIVCWPNPFFHLIYRELRAIHEFLADDYAIGGGDRYQYAELLVWQTISPSTLPPSFFNSPIKRRITMITKSKTSKTGYASRLMIVPVFFIAFCAFTVRLRTNHPIPHSTPLTVVIDAGHGGIDAGTIASDGTEEKSINLYLALKVKQLSSQYNIKVVLTRDKDQLSGNLSSIRESLEYRAKMATENKADLFIALHVDNRPEDHKGFRIYLSRENSHYSESAKLGSSMIDAIKGTYDIENDMKETREHVYVLHNATMPAILLSCGNISSPRDFAFITTEKNLEKIARDILQGIQQYQAKK